NIAVARYAVNGSADAAFGTSGTQTVDFSGQDDVGASVSVQSDRKIVVAGSTLGANNDFAVARLEGNSAPAIGTTPASFDAINEDDTANNGTGVSVLASRLNVSDPDGDVAGLAITARDDSHGTWSYSTDGGATWNAIGA